MANSRSREGNIQDAPRFHWPNTEQSDSAYQLQWTEINELCLNPQVGNDIKTEQKQA